MRGATQSRWGCALIGGVLLSLFGFAVGALGSAVLRRALGVSHRPVRVELSTDRQSPHFSRIVSLDPSSRVTTVDLTRRLGTDAPAAMRVKLRDSPHEVLLHFDKSGVPERVESSDGVNVKFTFSPSNVTMTASKDGKQFATRNAALPSSVQDAIARQRARYGSLGQRLPLRQPPAPLDRAFDVLVPSAHAQTQSDITITSAVEVTCHAGAPQSARGHSLYIETTCAPFSCSPIPLTMSAGTVLGVRVHLKHSAPRQQIPAPTGEQKFDRTREAEVEIQKQAAERSVSLGGVLLGLVSFIEGPIGWVANSIGIATQFVPAEQPVRATDIGEQRAYQDQLKAQIAGQSTAITVCLRGEKLGRQCRSTSVFHPFGADPVPAQRTLRFDLGGGPDEPIPKPVASATTPEAPTAKTASGTFTVVQQDQGLCGVTFAPKTGGKATFSWNPETEKLNVLMEGSGSGRRSGVRCNDVRFDTTWSQNYTIKGSTTVTKDAVAAGSVTFDFPASLKGKSYGVPSNCKSGGKPSKCPGVNNNPYTFIVRIVGKLDLNASQGSGTIVLKTVKLPTSGTWNVP